MDNATKISRTQTRVVAAVCAVAAAVATGTALLDWLGLSVDVLSRDEVVITGTELRLMEIPGGVVMIVAGVIAIIASILCLIGLWTRKAVAVLTVAAMAISIGFVAYTYLVRKDVVTDVIVEATATDTLPREDVERVVELALRVGGVAVEPRTGMLAAGIAGLVGVASGLILFRVMPMGSRTSEREARTRAASAPQMRGSGASAGDDEAASATSRSDRETDRPTGSGDAWAG